MGSGGAKYAQGMRRLAEQWPYARYLGMGAWWAWIWLCYSGTGLFSLGPSGVFAQQVGRMYLFSTPAIMVALIAAALSWRLMTPLLARRRVVVGISLLGVAGTLLIGLAPLVGGAIPFSLGAILTGFGTSVLALKTGEAYGTLGGREVLTAGSVSLVLASFLYFMGAGLPLAWQPLFIAALPLLGALLFVMPADDDPFPAEMGATPRTSRRAPGRRTYINLVLAGAVVAATAGFAKGVASTSMSDADFASTGAISTFFISLVALAICVSVNSGDIVRSVRRIYALLIILGVAVVFASVFGTSLAYLGVGKELLWMMFTCLMAYASFRFGFPPVRAFGFGQAAYLGASAGSWGLGMLCAPYLDTPTAHLILVGAMMLVIVLLFAFVFTDSDIKFIFTWRSADAMGEADGHGVSFSASASSRGVPADGRGLLRGTPMAEGNGAAADGAVDGKAGVPRVDGGLESRIDALPASLGISSRESQIMLFFAQGHSANWIAEELVISKNTVRSHIRSIYTKLDVHSRRELLDFLGQNVAR